MRVVGATPPSHGLSCSRCLRGWNQSVRIAHPITSRPKYLHSGHRLQQERGRAVEDALDPRITDTYASIRMSCQTPKNPIVLAHGLLGFDELHLVGNLLPGVQYWRGITEALTANGATVITASVPASATIEERAAKLGKDIEAQANGQSVNIIAHSMGGLDARYMVSRLRPPGVNVLSLTTIATPHRGSAFADYIFDQIGPVRLPKVYRALQNMKLETGAFSQLTRKYLTEDFNPRTPDSADVQYYSYGATSNPAPWSAFRQSHRIVEKEEGPNDGLVSVASSRWGQYMGTLVDVSHLDLINWTNRLRWAVWEMVGNKRNFNAVALYMDIGDMLAKKGF